jgi:hypothetical protein
MTKKDDFELTPSSKLPWWKNKKIVIPLALLFIIAAASSGGDSEESSSTTQSATESGTESAAPVASPEPVEEEPIGGEFGNYPEVQAKFVSIIETAKNEINDSETDLQRNVALRDRDKSLCATLSGNKASNWTGVVRNVGANGEGKAYVEIEIADRIKVKTWNNAFSDISDNTLISTSSSFFDNLVSMNKGDLVTFSGTFLKSSNSCLKRSNLTEVFYGISPEFVVRFSNVSKG